MAGLLGHRYAHAQAQIVSANGRELPVEVVLQQVVSDGAPSRFVAVVRDISERKRIEKLQSEFVSTVSHELRTPLTSIRGALGLVANGVTGALPAEAHEYVSIALANCERLVRLINDILDIEKMQSGRMEFQRRCVALDRVIEQAVATNAPGTNTGRVVISSKLPAGEIVIDPDRFQQVMTNLLSNAAKFAPSGSDIEVHAATTDGGVRIAVRDHGPGIPPEFRGRLFQRFAQADTSTTRRLGGTGLGLSICKAIVERLGGTIGHTDPAGGGAELYVELPLFPPVVARNVESRKLLVCEDDPQVCRIIERTLADAGFVIDLAPTIERARRLLELNRYDAITLDLELADGDGTLVLDGLDANVPVIVVSGSSRALGRAAQIVSAVVHKPFDDVTLRNAILDSVDHSARAARVLHVEDDPDIRKIVSRTLPATWEVVGAESFAVARGELAKRPFDVVVLDLSLPDGNGAELVPLAGNARIIIFSAGEASADLVREVSAALVKTRATPEQLRDVVVSLARRSGGAIEP